MLHVLHGILGHKAEVDGYMPYGEAWWSEGTGQSTYKMLPPKKNLPQHSTGSR